MKCCLMCVQTLERHNAPFESSSTLFYLYLTVFNNNFSYMPNCKRMQQNATNDTITPKTKNANIWNACSVHFLFCCS